MVNGERPWNLVAPWYRWDRQLKDEGRAPRQTRPVFQKFDEPDFVKDFVADPQKSLKFKDDVDRVFNVNLTVVPKPLSGVFAGRFTGLYAPKVGSGTQTASDAKLVPTGVRKLFLPTHKRYYLVVCELHCDAPGFPMTTPDQVCQSAFVVRRRSYNYPPGAQKEAADKLKNIVATQSEIAELEQTSPATGIGAKWRAGRIQKMIADGTFAANLADANARLDAARLDLRDWQTLRGVTPLLEGWIPSGFKNIGSWLSVAEKPQNVAESMFPLYPLFPDPNIPNHAAKGKNIYFGVVPGTSFDTGTNGAARFDDRSMYEIRCFVRRHKVGCPRAGKVPDCSGPLFWSEPTESYMLASHNDLIGTAQRPITIQIPSLEELAAQAANLPVAQLAPAKIVQPQGLNFQVGSDGKPSGGSVGPPQVCFFAIPLITIVALFVLKLFLPILCFLFGLFFLLQLKFCIPPSVSLDVGVKAQLDAIPPSVDIDVDLGASVALDLNANLQLEVIRGSDEPDSATAQLDAYSNVALAPSAYSIAGVAEAAKTETADTAVSVNLTASLEFEDHVEVKS